MNEPTKTLDEWRAEILRNNAEIEAAKWEPTMYLRNLHWNDMLRDGTGYIRRQRIQQQWRHRETGETQWRELPQAS